MIQLLLFGYAINTEPRHLPTAVLVQEDSVFARSIVARWPTPPISTSSAQARRPAELDEMIRQRRGAVRGHHPRRLHPPRGARATSAQILVEADATDPVGDRRRGGRARRPPAQALAPRPEGRARRRGAGAPPFEVVVHARYNPETITAYNIVPGLLGVILSLTLVMMTALGVTRETERGTMESLLATPVEPLEVMVGKLAPYVVDRPGPDRDHPDRWRGCCSGCRWRAAGRA